MFYFIMKELIGRDSPDAYDYYLFKVQWLEKNLPLENWSLDYSQELYVNGVNIPYGIIINSVEDSIKFCVECI